MGIFNRYKINIDFEKYNITDKKLKKKISKVLKSENIERILDYYLKRFDKTQISNFLQYYQNDKSLTNILLVNHFNFKIPYNDLLKKYNKDLITIYPKIINSEELEQFIPYMKNDLEQTKKIIYAYDSNKYIFNKYINNYELTNEEIFNNIDKIMLIDRLDDYFFQNTNKQEIVKILELPNEEIVKFRDVYTNIRVSEDGDKSTYKLSNDIIQYIIENPSIEYTQYIESILANVNKNSRINLSNFYNSKNTKQFTHLSEFLIKGKDKQKIEEIILYNLTGLHPNSIKLFLERIYTHEGSGEYFKEFTEIYDRIKKCETEEDYNKILKYINQNNLYFNTNDFYNRIIKYYNDTVKSEILNPNKIIKNNNSNVKYQSYLCKTDGKMHQVKIIRLDGEPFFSLTTTLSPKSREAANKNSLQSKFTHELIDNPSLWNSPTFSDGYKGTEYISMSFNSDKRFRFFSQYDEKKILLGFSNIGEYQIGQVAPRDLGMDMKSGSKIINTLELYFPDQLEKEHKKNPFDSLVVKSNTSMNYSEVLSHRNNIMPDYILIASRKNISCIPTIDNVAKEWAAFYNIPIIEIDCDKYYLKYKHELDHYIEKLKTSINIPSAKEIITLIDMCYRAEMFSETQIDYYENIMSVINIDNKNLSNEDISNLKYIINNIFTKYPGIISPVSDKLSYEEEKNILEIRKKQLEKFQLMIQKQELEDIKNNEKNQQNNM